MTQSDIRDKFYKAFNGNKNFLTPNIEKYGKRGKYLYELSSGRGMDSETIYGVTVITTEGEKVHDLCKGGFSLEEANNHIKNLQPCLTK